MKKAKKKRSDELRPAYKRSDFGELVRGKYAGSIAEASNIVLLDPDVAKAFPDSVSVNRALRVILEAAKTGAGR